MPKAKHREHGQTKKNAGIALTQDALNGLDEIAAQFGVSRSPTAGVSPSHLIEMIGRKQIPLVGQEVFRLGELLSS
jgi:hypothetical protein